MRKRLLSAGLAVLLLCTIFAGCSKKQTLDIGLIISEPGGYKGNNFNRSAWDGIQQYCETSGKTAAYFEPENRNDDEYRLLVQQAVEQGADVLVLPGYLLDRTVFTMQHEYPDVRFILLDGVPNNGDFDGDYQEETAENTYAVLYAEEQAGFLAGYAAVTEGLRNLGFFGGMSVPAVMRFGHGYVQGAEYAAAELELPPDAVELRYVYCGSFTSMPKYQARADDWYHNGTEVIFACGGAMGYSVIQAADSSQKWVIGVDTDQSEDSEWVLTSAVKKVSDSVYEAVKSAYEGGFPGGQSLYLGAEDGGVGLVMDTARFTQFDNDDYQAIFQLLADGQIQILKDDTPIEEIPLTHVNLRVE